MKIATACFLLLLAADVPGRPEAAIPYFSNIRQVQISQPDHQNFFVADQELWGHSRPDLGDLRLYDGSSPVQYAISEQRESVSSEEVPAKILNLGSVHGQTEFDIDATQLEEYDRIRLRLDAHDFVATASVSGRNAPASAANVLLPPSTLYDFTKEQLGSSSLLKLPASSFRYLHVKLSPGIRPDQVKGASIFNLREQKAHWTRLGSCSVPQQKQHLTVISCDLPDKTPLNRVTFQVAPAQVNFRRIVTVDDAKGLQIATGDISRVRVNRAGTAVTNEELSVTVNSTPGPITLTIDNRDNPPLQITKVDPLSTERRIYFDPQGKSQLTLYYGDDKLSSPDYDYARFFHEDPSASQAQLGPGVHNPQYAGRPDDRPWSERHAIVLWAAMLIAVVALAGLALRGLRASHA